MALGYTKKLVRELVVAAGGTVAERQMPGGTVAWVVGVASGYLQAVPVLVSAAGNCRDIEVEEFDFDP